MNEKSLLRKAIAKQKLLCSKEESDKWSLDIQNKIESLDAFNQAETILLYHSLPDEVQTSTMLSDWMTRKHCLLPQVDGNRLVVREHGPGNSLIPGYMNILEPTGNIFTDLNKIDLIIVPGVAYDTFKNRLGRGKGYYDKLLSQTKAITIGICFDFQLVEKVTVCAHDKPVNYVVTPTRLLF